MWETFFADYGIWAVLLAGFLEEIIFFIPSSIVFLAAGALTIKPGIELLPALFEAVVKVGFFGAVGVTLGSFVVYGLVYWGGQQLIVNYGKYFGVRWRDIEKFQQWFVRWPYDEAILTGARAIPIFSNTVISAFCGLIQLPVKEFIRTTFLGSLVRVGLLGFLGWVAGREYKSLSAQLENLTPHLVIGTAVLLIIILLAYLFYRRRSVQ